MFRYPILLLLSLGLLTLPAEASDFAKLRALDGVKSVEYDAPFLCIITRSLTDIPKVKVAVHAIEAAGSEPDVVALGGAYNVRFYNYDSYQIHLRDQARVKRTNSVGGLKDLCKYARFTTVVTLDWKGDPIIVSRQRYYHANLSLGDNWLVSHDENIDSVLKRINGLGKHPEKLVCFEYPTVGRLVYPVFDGKISLSGNKVSYDAFAAVFKDLD